MLHIFATLRSAASQSFRVPSFAALAFFICLTAAQPTLAQLSLTVTRNDDRNNAACVSGDCSLREAVNAANAAATNDTINFASGLTTITLTNEIAINGAGTLTINGLGANNLTIDGGPGTNRIFRADSASLTISGMTLTGGNGTSSAIYSGDYFERQQKQQHSLRLVNQLEALGFRVTIEALSQAA